MEKQEIIQYDNGYISKTPIFQFILLSCLFRSGRRPRASTMS